MALTMVSTFANQVMVSNYFNCTLTQWGLYYRYLRLSMATQYDPIQRDYSNNVLVTLDGGVFFLPAYLRIVFIETNQLNIRDLSALLSATLVITVFYKNLPQDLIPELHQLSFSAKNVDRFTLVGSGQDKNCYIRNNVDQYTMQYIYKGKLPLRIQSDVLLAPFDLIDFELLLTFHPKHIITGNVIRIIKLNFMDIEDMESKILIMYKDSNISGAYGLAESTFSVEYQSERFLPLQQMKYVYRNFTRPRPRKVQMAPGHQTQRNLKGLTADPRVMNWRFVKFTFQMYRYPTNTLVIIFVPMVILSFINLMIFWGSVTDVSSKLQTVAGLMIAYAALLPTIRDKIPPSPRITLMEYLVYALSLNVIFSSLDTVLSSLQYKRNPSYRFVWNKNWAFILSLSVTILSVVILGFLLIIHKLVWEPRYNYLPPRKYGLQFENFQTVTSTWSNHQASQYLKNKTTLVQADHTQPDLKQRINNGVRRPDTEKQIPIQSIEQLGLDKPKRHPYNSPRRQFQQKNGVSTALLTDVNQRGNKPGQQNPRTAVQANNAWAWGQTFTQQVYGPPLY